ncbi:MAG: hypothetical protein ABS934_10075 [Psychrobacillus sp.]
MINLSDGLKIGAQLYPFIPPLILLFIVPIFSFIIFRALFGKILPTKIFKFFIVPVLLLGFYIWAGPMKIGFYEYFRAAF